MLYRTAWSDLPVLLSESCTLLHDGSLPVKPSSLLITLERVHPAVILAPQKKNAEAYVTGGKSQKSTYLHACFKFSNVKNRDHNFTSLPNQCVSERVTKFNLQLGI